MSEQFIEMLPEREFAGQCVSLKCRIVTPEQEKICFVEVESVAAETDVTDLMDPWLRLFIFDMMARGGEWEIRGKVSRSCLRNMERFADYWHCIDGGRCRKIALLAPAPVDDSAWPTDDGALLPFSGGLDASYTAYRHTHHLAGHKNMDVRAAMMVHGADIALNQKDYFERSLQHNREMLADLGITKVHVIRTNYREIGTSCMDWGLHTHMAVLMGLASFLSPLYHNVVVGSTYPYPVAPLLWGSNPVSDQMLSSPAFSVWVDDFSKGRTDKAELVAQWPVGMQRLRVCYESSLISTEQHNCGHCEKCIRTNLNFLACGVQLPGMPVLSLAEIAENRGEIHLMPEYTSLLEYTHAHHCEAPWVAVMEKKMKRNRFLLSLPRLVKRCWNRWVRMRANAKYRHAATKAEHWEKHVYIRNRSIPL